jgi:5-methylcytosine-specific restriction enzyme B
MENPFILTDKKIRILLETYTAWAQATEKEKNYATDQAEKSAKIKTNLLNKEYISGTKDEQFIQDILEYSKTLEGPASIRIGRPRVTTELKKIKRNLLYLIDSPDDPFEKAVKILEADYKIPFFAKAFWSPIFQAQYPEILPNWNNKTDNFLKKVGVDIKTSTLSIKQKYRLLSEAFQYLQNLDSTQNFYTLNHLMHYGTEVPEGAVLLDDLIYPFNFSEWINSEDTKKLIDKYIQARKSGDEKQWSEEYKWDILPKAHNEFNKAPLSAENLLDKMTILFKHNPPEGSFVHWSNIDDLKKLATKDPDRILVLLTKLFQETMPLYDRIDDMIKECKEVDKSAKLGTPLFGYILALHDYHKYPLYKDSVFQAVKKRIGKGKVWTSLTLGMKYEKYQKLCIKMGQYLTHNNLLETITFNGVSVPAGITALDGQDFFYWCEECDTGNGDKIRYWQIAPGEAARLWDDLKKHSIAAVGYAELDFDLTGKTKDELLDLGRQYYPNHTEHKLKTDMTQLWNFLSLKSGDKFITNKGRSLLLGLGEVKGAYKFRSDRSEYKHTVDVNYSVVSEKGIPIPGEFKGKFGKTIVPLKKEEFEAIKKLFKPNGDGYFTDKTFELLDQLHSNPTRIFYQEHSAEFKESLENPFQKLFHQVATSLPLSITQAMETEKGIFSRILKNDFGKGGAWDFYWGAFYPKGGKRISDAQLFMWIHRDRLEFGFYIGEYGSDQRNRFIRNCRANHKLLFNILNEGLADSNIQYGEHAEFIGGTKGVDEDRIRPSLQEWLKNPEEAGIHAGVFLPKEEVLHYSTEQFLKEIVQTYLSLFPLILLATLDDPMPAIGEYVGDGPPLMNPEYPLHQVAKNTGFDESYLERWVWAINRKGQVIIYGPPGTGKTYMAEHLAKHLIGGGDGFSEIVQFHPAYAYEDFIQGIRPKAKSDGQLDYPILPGRFLEFCEKARGRKDQCVLIVDEINRANLARVFGELMYLLEYRDREVPLAGGGVFQIPDNVRIIGTMNTADRSIALVDHALRRRFAFLALCPNYDVLKKYHESTGFKVEPLINVLTNLNKQIGDRHYEVGISFFLKKDLYKQIEDIWRMEIEPYLEEYFFDQQDKRDDFRWEKVGKEILS